MIEILDAIRNYVKPEAGIRIKVGVSQNQMADLSRELQESFDIKVVNVATYKGMDIEFITGNSITVNLN